MPDRVVLTRRDPEDAFGQSTAGGCAHPCSLLSTTAVRREQKA